MPNVAPLAPRASSRTPSLDRLEAEGALLTQARARLRSGDAGAALATLQQLDRDFPRGVLGQEREILGIQTLVALGKTAAAERRARAFVKAHPNSPHAPLLRPLTGDP